MQSINVNVNKQRKDKIMTNKILKTKNVDWGFWGTTAQHYSLKITKKRWTAVFKTLLELSGAEPYQIRRLLDSRAGRHFADQCYGEKNVKQITKECYFSWLEQELFDDENSKMPLETEKSSFLFGTNVYNTIYDRVDVVLYTYKNKNRIHEDYAMCITKNQKKYRIGMDYIRPIEDMDEDELCRAGLA